MRLGSTGLFICAADERPRLGRSEAQGLLQRCLTDASTIHALRGLLGFSSADSVAGLDDQQILQELAKRIESGEFLLFGEVIPTSTGGRGRQNSETVVKAPPPRAARANASPAPAQSESPLFPANADLAALAGALQGASASGAPFCDH